VSPIITVTELPVTTAPKSTVNTALRSSFSVAGPRKVMDIALIASLSVMVIVAAAPNAICMLDINVAASAVNAIVKVSSASLSASSAVGRR